MKKIFFTGATGFLGSYAAQILLEEHDTELAILTRAKSRQEGVEKLWKALQLHMDAERFYALIDRVEIVPGDLTAPRLGMDETTYARLASECESVLHIAASLNRKSAKACLNHNLRGTLSVLKFARNAANQGGLRRYSHVSTVAVAGHRCSEHVLEDEAIEWDRSDYDPYGRTKKFCEHMARELLPDVPLTFFRPSTVLGDSRFAETTQFDMLRALIVLADMPVVPLRPDIRVDIVNADWVGRAVATIHVKEAPRWDTYHLSAGAASLTTRELARSLSEANDTRMPIFAPRLEAPFSRMMDGLAGMKKRNAAQLVGSLFKVFLPYITYDTVFDNARAVEEIGLAPTPFGEYGGPLVRFAKSVDYRYPHRPLPPRESKEEALRWSPTA